MYKEALKHDPENPDLFYNLGVVAIEQKQPDKGLETDSEPVKLAGRGTIDKSTETA